MINFSRIENNLYLGSAPANSVDAARLKSMNVTAVLCLQSNDDFKAHRISLEKLQNAYSYNEIQFLRFPIQDFDETDLGNRLPEPVRALNNLLSVGHTVYLHCNVGVCRAPATLLAYLCHYRDMSIQAGLDYIREQRPQVNPYIGAVNRALIELQEGN